MASLRGSIAPRGPPRNRGFLRRKRGRVALPAPLGAATSRAVDPAEYDLMDAAEDGMWWYRAVHARLLDALAERPGAPGVLLDAGCGTGGFLARLAAARAGARLAGLEYHPDAARRATRKSGAAVAAGDINRLPFPNAAFGAVVSVDVLCHRAVDEAATLAELHRVLQPGGTLLLNLPAFEWLKSAHDERVHTARRYTAARGRAMLAAAGFAAVEARYWNSLLLPLMVAQRKLLARDGASDVKPYPAWLDALLHAATRAERALARLGVRYPAGGSVLLVATRP
jgi:SAM-dependent methyltransferase